MGKGIEGGKGDIGQVWTQAVSWAEFVTEKREVVKVGKTVRDW